MAYMITHFYPGGTARQYEATVEAVHPSGGMPAGQVHHAAGPCEGGWLVVAIWDSKASCDRFVNEVLIPTLPSVNGGFAGAPQERAAEVAYLHSA